jgi:hypothetical protein
MVTRNAYRILVERAGIRSTAKTEKEMGGYY